MKHSLGHLWYAFSCQRADPVAAISSRHEDCTGSARCVLQRRTAEHVVDEAVTVGGLLGNRERRCLPDDGHVGGLEVQDAQRRRHWCYALCADNMVMVRGASALLEG